MSRHGGKKGSALPNLNAWIAERLGDRVPSSSVPAIMAARGLFPTQDADGSWRYAERESVGTSAA